MNQFERGFCSISLPRALARVGGQTAVSTSTVPILSDLLENEIDPDRSELNFILHGNKSLPRALDEPKNINCGHLDKLMNYIYSGEVDK